MLTTHQAAFIVLFMGAFIRSEDKFYFAISPEDVTAVSGTPVTLSCAVSDATAVRYDWRLKGQPLAPTTRRFAVATEFPGGASGQDRLQGSELRITRADRIRDSGEITCIATNTSSGFSLTSRAATIEVQWISETASVQLQTPESASLIRDGNEVILRCHVDGSGEIRVDWYLNGERLDKSDHVTPHGKRLHLRGVTPRDNGVYRCTAHNRAGSVASSDNFALAIPGDRWPQIKVTPMDVIARVGSPVRLDCIYENAVLTEWYYKETGPLENSTRWSILSNSSLLIPSANATTEGMYACVGIHGESKEVPLKYSAEVTLAYLQDLSLSSFEPDLPASRTKIVPEKSEFQITCKPPLGVPKAKIWWLTPRGRTVSDFGPVRVDDTMLIIEEAKTREDDGNYTCVAENIAGTKSFSFNLVVSTPPVVTNHPSNVTVDEDEPAEFSCNFSGMPHPLTVVRWTKDGRLLREDGMRILSDASNGTLKFTSVQLSDRGTYTCVVNTTGLKPEYSKPASLHIIEKLKFMPRPVNKKLELGSVAKVNCKAQGSSTPDVRWIKMDLPKLDELSHISDKNGTLVFNGVTAKDKGRYSCIASNAQGTINATINIDVIVTPKFTVEPDNPTYADEGYPIVIDCAAEGDPKPTIQWDKDSVMKDFDDKRFRVLDNGSLLIQEVQYGDYGKYGCTAGNSGGFKRKEVVLLVKSTDGYVPGGRVNEPSMMTKTVTISLSAAAAYMFLVVGLMVWCRYRRRRMKAAYLAADAAEGTGALLAKCDNVEAAAAVAETELGNQSKKNRKSGSHNGVANHNRSDGENTAQSQGSNQSKRSKNGYDALSFSRQDLYNMMLLGRGEFGEVYLAQGKGLAGQTAAVDDKQAVGVPPGSSLGVVMVKALQQTRDESALLEFRRQLDLFQRTQHKHVVRVLGLCRDQDPHYMLLQYTDWGDLKQFLLATREKSSRKSLQSPHNCQPPRPDALTLPQIMSLATQAAQGLEHISNLRQVHRDVAARNCLIASGLQLKISLSGLSRDTYSREYYTHRNKVLPVRWLPHEAVFEDDFSSKTDVYSFGGLVWELFTQAELPFHRINDAAVISALEKRQLQWKTPKNVPPQMASLLGRCWADSPRDRPTFAQIILAISEIQVPVENTSEM